MLFNKRAIFIFLVLISTFAAAQNSEVLTRTITKDLGEYKNKNGTVTFELKIFKNANNDSVITKLLDIHFKAKKPILAGTSGYLIIAQNEIPKLLEGLKTISKIVKIPGNSEENFRLITDQYKVLSANYFKKDKRKYMPSGWMISLEEVYRIDMSTKPNQLITIYEEDIDSFISLFESALK